MVDRVFEVRARVTESVLVRLVLVGICSVAYSTGRVGAATIVNGSMNDTGNNYNSFNALTPSGWTQNFANDPNATADIFNSATTFQHFAWSPSSDGGTFVHGLSQQNGVGGLSGEGVVQAVSGLTIGAPCTITFEQAISNAFGGESAATGFWRVTFGSTLDSAPMAIPALDVPSGWQGQSMVFVPSSTTQQLSFLAVVTSPGLRVDMGLDGVSIACQGGSSVGVNKDFKNTTGQNANDIEILLKGTVSVLQHYDGYPANHFATFAVTTEAPGNTRLHWSNPNNPVLPNQVAHVGFLIPGTDSHVIMGVFWTLDGNVTGCAHQVNTPHAAWGINPGNLVTYTNNCVACESVSLYAGAATIRWYADWVPLESLNAASLGSTTPLRIDTIAGAPILLAPNESVRVSIPAAPVGAKFAVLSHKVGTDPGLATGNETDDFIETTAGSAIVPALSSWGLFALTAILVASGFVLLNRKKSVAVG